MTWSRTLGRPTSTPASLHLHRAGKSWTLSQVGGGGRVCPSDMRKGRPGGGHRRGGGFGRAGTQSRMGSTEVTGQAPAAGQYRGQPDPGSGLRAPSAGRPPARVGSEPVHPTPLSPREDNHPGRGPTALPKVRSQRLPLPPPHPTVWSGGPWDHHTGELRETHQSEESPRLRPLRMAPCLVPTALGCWWLQPPGRLQREPGF